MSVTAHERGFVSAAMEETVSSGDADEDEEMGCWTEGAVIRSVSVLYQIFSISSLVDSALDGDDDRESRMLSFKSSAKLDRLMTETQSTPVPLSEILDKRPSTSSRSSSDNAGLRAELNRTT